MDRYARVTSEKRVPVTSVTGEAGLATFGKIGRPTALGLMYDFSAFV
jgi:hypothetical protein